MHRVRGALFALCCFALLVCCRADAARFGSPYKIVDASANDATGLSMKYAYAPCMIYENGVYHLWFGSWGNDGVGAGWDKVRYSTSTDGVNWTTPKTILSCTNLTTEICCCDPSVVYKDGYWYCFYSGYGVNVGTRHFVARATSPGGPYHKYTMRGTWEQSPSDPKPIIDPARNANTYAYYGSGQASVVLRGGKFLMWHHDDTSQFPTASVSKLYYRESSDGVNWSAATETSLSIASADVKYNPYTEVYNLYDISGDHSTTPRIVRYFSRDGVHWSPGCNATDLPPFSHNPGVLGDKTGWVCLNGKTIIAFGCPYDLNTTDNHGYWDLYGAQFFDPLYVKGDFDGDHKLDACMVNPITGRWYIRSSLTGQQGVPGIPWGWQFAGMNPTHRIACGDYDGDGKTDICIVDPYATNGARWYCVPSSGALPFAWGWQWFGQESRHLIVPGDFDGDGRADRSIIDPTNPGGTSWFCIGSTSAVPFWAWTWSGMEPYFSVVTGDFDGDHKTDRAIVNPDAPGGSSWFCIGGTGGTPLWGSQWAGIDKRYSIVEDDYDGDGKTDRAAVGPCLYDGTNYCGWYVLRGNGTQGTTDIPYGWKWEGMTDIHQAVPGDYDGDGVADACIVSADVDNSGCTWFDLSSQVPWGWKLSMPYATDDATVGIPPSTPLVTDSGPYTTDLTKLQASWTASDAAYGIAEYKYAIGTVPGGSNILGWQSVGSATSITRSGLSLLHGRKYYVSAKAMNGNGLWSAAGISDGITAVDPTSPSTFKNHADGATITLPCVTVTAQFANAFYAQELNATTGIRVQGSSGAATEGDYVSITGTLSTIDGERTITNPTVTLLK